LDEPRTGVGDQGSVTQRASIPGRLLDHIFVIVFCFFSFCFMTDDEF